MDTHLPQGAKRLGKGALLLLAVLSVAVAASLSAQSAAAADYTVEICTPTTRHNVNTELEFVEESGSTNFFLGGCFGFPAPGQPALDVVAKSGATTGAAHWKLNAPAGTLIRSVEANRIFPPSVSAWDGGMRWVVFEGPPEEELFELDGKGLFLPPDEAVTWTPASPTPSFTGRLSCPSASCNNTNGTVQILFSDVIAHMVDSSAPGITVSGPLLAGGPLRGAQNISFRATDVGSGVAKVSLLVDDQVKDTATDSNGGKCAAPYKAMAPCKAEINSMFTLDTGTLSDESHKVQVAVEDAAGQVTSSAAATIAVHNGPTNTARPLLSGTAKIGGQLVATSGAWEGSPSFAYQWLLCPPTVIIVKDVGGCKPISGEVKPQHELGAADVYQRDVVRVTATNVKGSESAFSTPSDLIADAQGRTSAPGTPPRGGGGGGDTVAPQLTNVSLSRRRFRVPANRGAKKNAASVLRVSSSEAGRASIVIERVRRGRKPTRAGKISSAIQTGSNRIPVSGRIGGRRLTAANYRMTITVSDAAGNVSKPTRLSFTVLAG